MSATRRLTPFTAIAAGAFLALLSTAGAPAAMAAPLTAQVPTPLAAHSNPLVEKAQFGRRGFRAGPRRFSGGPRFYGGPRSYNRGFRAGRYVHGRRWRGGRWIGPAIVGSVIVGSALASRSYADDYYVGDYGRDRWELCAETYRSFRWSDGTFQPYGGGPRQLCPYLR